MRRAQDQVELELYLDVDVGFIYGSPTSLGYIKHCHTKQRSRNTDQGSRRAYTYKALNKLIQGSAADMTKKAMVELYKEGIIPHIQVHDELDISVKILNMQKK